MNTEFAKQFEDLGTAMLDSAKRLGEIQLRVAERTVERQLAVASDCVQAGVSQLKLLESAPTDPQGVAAGQVKIFEELNAKLGDHAAGTVELMKSVKDEYAAWLETGMKAATAAAPKAPAKKAA